MADGKTLLAHLAPKLDDHTENIAVEALGYILNSSVPVVRALEEVLRTGGTEPGSISHTRTQYSDEKGRPDLSCLDEYGVERVLIEAKFWAGLTDNQPIAYLDRLRANQPSALLFVAPAARIEPLWAELLRHVAESEEFELGARSEQENLRSVIVGDDCRLILTSWRALLERMASHASAAGDSRAETDIRQLLGLTQRLDEDAFLPIRSDEFGAEFPRRIVGLRRLIIDVAGRGRDAGWIDTSGLQVSGNWYGLGQNMRLGRIGHEFAFVWFGYNFDHWSQHRDTPMWLELGSQDWRIGSKELEEGGLERLEVRRRLQSLQQEAPPGIIDGGDRLLVPVFLLAGVEYTAVVDKVTARLESIAGMIDPQM